MKIVHLSCGLGNRLFAIMRMLTRYRKVEFVWENMGTHEHVSFFDLFEFNYPIKFNNFSTTSSILIDGWIRPQHKVIFNTTGKKILKSWTSDGVGYKTIGCCICGLPKCIPEIAKHILPHKSLQDDLKKIKLIINKSQSALHIRNNPAESGYSPHPKHIRKFLKQKYSFVAFEKDGDVNQSKFLTQNHVRQYTHNRNTLTGLRSAVFDMFALSYAKDIISTKKYSSFHQMSSCLKLAQT